MEGETEEVETGIVGLAGDTVVGFQEGRQVIGLDLLWIRIEYLMKVLEGSL